MVLDFRGQGTDLIIGLVCEEVKVVERGWVLIFKSV